MARQQQRKQKEDNIRLPLIGSYTNRSSDAGKDQRFVNIFPETRKVEAIESTKIFLNKRPGLSLYKDFGTGEGRGCIWFNNKFYVVVGNKVIEDGGTPTDKITLTGSTGPVGMVLGNSSTIGDYLFVCDGTSGWVIKSDGTVLTISNSGVRSISVITAGSGYVSNPKVYLSGGAGSGATATATTSGGALSSISVTADGTGYTSAPTVSFQFTPTAVDATGNTITYAGHQLVNGDRVKLAGTPPGGLNTSTKYYVVGVSGNLFQVSLTAGGAAVDITTSVLTFQVLTGAPDTEGTALAYLNAFPTPHIPTPTFLDGYIILPQRSDVYNCILDEPTDWDSGQYLTAEMFPDAVVGLAKQNNQVVVFGGNSIEFFYDAANVNGSPLARNDSTTIQMGNAAPYAVYQNEKYFIFIAESESGGRAVWQVEGFQPKRVSDEFIDRIIDAEVDMADCRGYGLRTMGHLFYIINLPTINRTLVYDTDEKLWHEWSNNNAGSHEVFSCNYMCDNGSGSAYLLHKSNGTLYKLDTTVYQDDGTAILVDLTTNRYDMDTIRRKFMRNFRIVGDRYASGNSVDVKWTDDDYQTWSNTKTIALTDDFPNFARGGAFRRRAFNIKNALNYPLRLESLEVTYMEGDS
jgi:hypothetical protein